MKLGRYIPLLDWGRHYNREDLSDDSLAAVIVTIMLIPQSLAYALLAGLPPHIGLYASILPLIGYMIFGTSRALAVGPVAVVSLMTAAAVGQIAASGTADYLAAAIMLAFLSGAILLLMGLLRLGFLADFLSHPVVSGFITASGIIIAVSQLKHILGVDASGHSLLEIGQSLYGQLGQMNRTAIYFGVPAILFMLWSRSHLEPALRKTGLPSSLARTLAKAGPLAAIFAAIGAVQYFGLQTALPIVGDIPNSLPKLAIPQFDTALMSALILPAFMISIIGFVESVSVARTLAARKNQNIDPNQELLGLGSGNILSSLSGGYPVTGGFARSVVNFDAGAATPAAGGLTAIGIALATVYFTPFLYFLPKAILAATIIVAVLALVDFATLKHSWVYSKSDFAAAALTIAVTLSAGVEVGVATGALASVVLYLLKSSQPHIAEIGQVPQTQHFRNVLRHKVVTSPRLLSLRVDENLFFANAVHLQRFIEERMSERVALKHVVLNCVSVSQIDGSALDVLQALNATLSKAGIAFHLSEVKGPVEDRLERNDFLAQLSGRVFLHHYEAVSALDEEVYPPLELTRKTIEEVDAGSHI